MPFDPATAFAPISTMAQFDLLVLVEAKSPLHTLKQAFDAARADPQKFNVGTINPGSTQNVTGELLRSMSGIPITGRAASHLRRSADRAAARRHADRRRILCGAEVGDRRQPDPRHRRRPAPSVRRKQPDVPTFRESGFDAAVDGWNSLVAPAGTPREIIAFLNGHVRAIIDDPGFSQRMVELGGEPVASSPEELDARLKSDIELWAAVVKKVGLEPQ